MMLVLLFDLKFGGNYLRFDVLKKSILSFMLIIVKYATITIKISTKLPTIKSLSPRKRFLLNLKIIL